MAVSAESSGDGRARTGQSRRHIESAPTRLSQTRLPQLIPVCSSVLQFQSIQMEVVMRADRVELSWDAAQSKLAAQN